MRSVSYRLADLNHVTVPLGFRGENEHTRVIIDCKKAFDEYPNAIPSLAVSPPNGAAYPAVIVRDGDLVYWDVRDSDLSKEGRGTAQLTFTEDGVVRKDDIFKTVIGKSILPAGPAPDPIADWITEANRAIGTIEGAMETAQEAAEEASGSATAAAGSAAAAADQATAAAESAEAARSAAGEAAQRADDAAESARTSASSATAAAGSADSAAGSATQAAGSAEAAAGSAVEAGTSAAAAAGSATAAEESATNASEAEANASEQATAAAASEANAADSATAAATSETNAANSETNAAASAAAAAGSASDAANSATAAAASAASAASAAEALIDDTGTATNKTWSAKKISDENSALLTEINSCLENTGVRITSTNKSQYFTDCNDAPNNSIYEISNSAQMANCPMGYDLSSASGVYSGTVRSVMGYPNGTLYTFKVSSSTQQFFITNNSASRQIIWFRIKYSSNSAWTDWKLASNVATTSGANFAIRKKFIAPYLDGEGNPTVTDTGTPNPQYIADDPFVFNDFDNAPRNSIYQIDLDCDASVMAHNPAPGKSSILITTNFAWDYKHGEMQMCVGLDGPAGSNSFMFWRYGYYGAGQVYHFTPWNRVATEVPWELIREDTVTNATEADIEITVDGNNNAFELTDVVLMFETPKQNTASGKGDYGAVRFYYTANNYLLGYPGAWTQNANANANGTHWIVENKNGLVFCEFTTKTETATGGQMRIPYKEGFSGSAQGIQPISNFSVSKINIRAVTGTGHYKLYGKRKPT